MPLCLQFMASHYYISNLTLLRGIPCPRYLYICNMYIGVNWSIHNMCFLGRRRRVFGGHVRYQLIMMFRGARERYKRLRGIWYGINSIVLSVDRDNNEILLLRARAHTHTIWFKGLNRELCVYVYLRINGNDLIGRYNTL